MTLLSSSKKRPKKRPKTRRKKRKETKVEALLRVRGSETIGFGFLIVALLFAASFITYSPDDPSFFTQTSHGSNNLLGNYGSYMADIMHRILGAAFWLLPLAFLVWGLRMMLHYGANRVLPRLILAPIAVVLGAILFSAYVPGAGWEFNYGLGGMLGDAVLKNTLGLIPLPLALALKVLTVIVALLFLALGLYVLGLSRLEARLALRYFLAGLVVVYVMLRGVVAKMAPSLSQGVRKGAGTLGAGLTAAGQKGLSAAQAAKKQAMEKRQAQKATQLRAKENQESRFADRLDTLREKNTTPKESAAQRPDSASLRARLKDDLPARIGADDPDEVIDSEAYGVSQPDGADTGTPDRPRLGGVRRATGAVPDPQAAMVPSEQKPPQKPEPRVKYPESKLTPKSKKALAEEQPSLGLEPREFEGYETPPLSLLENATDVVRHHLSDDELNANARLLETVLDDYGVKGKIVRVRPGPVVTMYELEPAAGLKASRVIGLADDIARSMSALAARVSTVPGRSIIGIELPNENREMVLLREIFAARAFGDSKHKLPMALGKDIGGEPVVVNLAKMPHLLIAGTTGSGKSVGINTMILSLLYALSPEECRLIMIDPKMLELSVYDGIPHLLSPVVTDPKKAVVALKWAVGEMEERYRKMSKLNVRGIEAFNGRIEDALRKGEAFTRTVQTGFDDETGEPVFETEEYSLEKMPYIVVVVDEMADLMMVAGKEIEACIQRLAQMARAAGIHLIMATQRPSVDVITGTIKANFPTRISFQVTSKIDSRTVLGEMGAEQLLGKGDMLFMAGGGRITRVHGPFVSDQEVEEVVNFLKSQGAPEYVSSVVEGPKGGAGTDIDAVLGLGTDEADKNALLDQAIAIVARDRKCSISYIQRKLSIGYNKAAKLVEEMEDMGVVSPANHVGKREVLVPESSV
ncbi:MAG: DNA translocase FtsK 4TM domain-containing protein [Rhodobacteraceae bacterium]|nr:DNA translocase FtsK 4TM domain-containing protein [Paracoccaceae bacterium]